MKKRWKEDSAAQLTELAALLATQPEDLPSEATEEVVKAWIEEKGYGLGAVMNCFRLALVGAAKGPHLFDITRTARPWRDPPAVCSVLSKSWAKRVVPTA